MDIKKDPAEAGVQQEKKMRMKKVEDLKRACISALLDGIGTAQQIDITAQRADDEVFDAIWKKLTTLGAEDHLRPDFISHFTWIIMTQYAKHGGDYTETLRGVMAIFEQQFINFNRLPKKSRSR